MPAEQFNLAEESKTKAGQTQAFIDALANRYKTASRDEPEQSVANSLKSYEDWLDTAHTFFRDATEQELTLTYASEWVLDNYYIIRQAIRQIHQDLPPGFYDELPKLTGGRWQGYPRIYGIAHDFLIHQQMLVNFTDLQAILIALQEQVPLTMGELWALPIFLRYGLIEALAYALEAIIHPKTPPNLPATDLQFVSGAKGSNAEKSAISSDLSTPLDASSVVSNSIISLRGISEQDWNTFFESIDLVDQILSEDPAGVYSQMDFKTRDLYRKEIEALSLATGREEHVLAEIALEMARHGAAINGHAGAQAERRAHVGTYLLGEGRPSLEEQMGYQPKGKKALQRWARSHPSLVYIGGIFLITLILILIFLLLLLPETRTLSASVQVWTLIISALLVLIPALTISVNLINWLVNLLVPPRILPKMDFVEEIPQPFQTLVAVPALITSPEEVDSLVRQMQGHYLRNPEPGLLFALLTDFGDAESEHLPEDAELEQRAKSGIEALNQQYARPDGTRPFYFFHRRRLYNPRQDMWIGWERKRGKLHEMNRLLLEYDGQTPDDLTFSILAGELDNLKNVRFVITLDADTVLPRGAARRLVGALAHPLNRAVFDESTGRVMLGYTVLQPRIEINPTSANHSWFTRIFAGDTGLDLYTLAVSDTYHDLFGEGIYVGKGIYDVEAFERSVAGRIPENTVLSHDLLEGLMGRAGLATDITLIEDYPPNYFVQALRQQRWIRGDWQLLPWLLSTSGKKSHFSTVDHWKMIDNLRRSLLSPVLILLVILGLFVLPGQPWLWMAVILITLGSALLISAARGVYETISGEPVEAAFHPVAWDILRWLIAIAFLPFEAYLSLEAILVTLYRVLFSHKLLLEWTSAAHTTRVWGLRAEKSPVWLRVIPVSLLALILTGLFWLVGWHTHPANLLVALPVLILWLVSPAIAEWITRPIQFQRAALGAEEMELIRRIGRRTWAFFEHYVGPEDHWLPPDHYQESPAGIVAHHTSPTNIGLLLVSSLSAYDLGYLDALGLATRLMAAFGSMDQLERYRGHFLNWYDTLTLKPLSPCYVSTVDSGNLAACLIIIAQACKTIPEEQIFRWALWQGYLDSLSIFKENISELPGSKEAGGQKKIFDQITAMQEQIKAVKDHPEQWYSLFQEITGSFWKKLSEDLLKQVQDKEAGYGLETLRQMQLVANQVELQHMSVSRTIQELVSWIPILENLPDLLKSPEYAESMSALRAELPYSPQMQSIRAHTEAAREKITDLRAKLEGTKTAEEQKQPVRDWLDSLEQAIAHASSSASVLLHGFSQIKTRAETYVRETDFAFLYHPQRHIFHIGYNLDSGQLDNNYYDLLASEARIASLIAIAKGDIPTSHWLHLNRPVTRVDGMRVLLSWSATMFEYLMPSLFLRGYPGTLLAESAEGAIDRQIGYGKSKGVPWGISESGFYRFDASQNYQYRAFGVPGLGFKRGLGDDLVISPYSSLMAICQNPTAVARNAADLIDRKLLGLYGFYEAIDFTKDRLELGQESAIVREYMAHHQGMIMLALDNFINNDIMVDRMHNDANIQSIDLLLQEQVPLAAPLQSPYAEDVKGTQRIEQKGVEVTPWSVPVQTPIPEVHLLSNGSYSVLISNTGAGYSTLKDTDLTRWQPDPVLDPWGTWIYIQDLPDENAGGKPGKLWSAEFQPIPGDPRASQVTFFAHMVVYHRTEDDMVSTLEVTVHPDDPVEIRRLYISNSGDIPRRLRLTSYGEVILAAQNADARHPAFNKLFIENEYVPELNLQIFKRRPRAENEVHIYLGHMLILREGAPDNAHQADRYRFIGRDQDYRSPAALCSGDYLTGASGATLDPIFSLGQEIHLGAGGNTQVAYLTFAADTRDAIIDLARRYQEWQMVERAFHQADITAQSWLAQQNMDSTAVKNILQALSALVFPFKAARAAPDVIAANTLGQPGLWRFGISGDYPILLVELEDPRSVDLVREVLQAHRYLRSRRFLFDVVILNKQQTDYGAELNGMLYRLVSRVNSEQWLNQRGGIFILYADKMHPEERTLLQTAARLVVSGDRGSLGEQLPGYSIQVPHLPEFTPTENAEIIANTGERKTGPAEQTDQADLQFFNGYGGFSQDGREYIILLQPGKPTPAPWVNVIGYPEFGFMVTEAGSQCTWSANSGENRLTPWSNDPVRDPSGEALYLRDEETGQVWTPTPLPSSREFAFIVRHGAGYTQFEHESHGLNQRLRLFASPSDPVKIIQLRVENTWDRPRRITATQYVEWVLGTTHAASQPFLVPEYDGERSCLLVTNPYNSEFSHRAAFLAASKAIHGVTADRAEFLGRNGSTAHPLALTRLGLEQRITPGEDVCGVLQVHLDLPPNGAEEIYFLVGQGDDKDHALKLVEAYHDAQQVAAAWQQTQDFWERLLDAIQVQTPQPAIDLILNRWLLYQALSCRVWGRTAFYQSSGAFGFRDQLQDVLATLYIDPSIAREQILNSAERQFEEGDVLHWWHPPSGRGIRTRFSDDLLWLPYVTALYVEATGDTGILEAQIPYLHAEPLKPGENERYGLYPQTEQSYSLLDHCRRAIEKGATAGPHQLPLIGTGDWNDGLNRVGDQGKGESVWLAWFLIDVLNRFAEMCERYQQPVSEELGKTIEQFRARAKAYADHIEESAWDGAWYRRAYYDAGAPLGSKDDPESKIDSIAQSWAILSGAGQPEHTRQAMQSVLEKLVRPDDRLILLFTPPFDKTPRDPGYIKGYLPGTRENGGQYTHAATWTCWAYTRMGDGKQAAALYDLLNPIFHSDQQEKTDDYRVEPYVICADIYSAPPYVRRGGWTWYTGSAAWMYRLGLEAILGFQVTGEADGKRLRIRPAIAPEWDGFKIRYRFGKATYHIEVSNPDHTPYGVTQVTLDGNAVEGDVIPLSDDGREHQVRVVMGEKVTKSAE